MELLGSKRELEMSKINIQRTTQQFEQDFLFVFSFLTHHSAIGRVWHAKLVDSGKKCPIYQKCKVKN
jgi:hypothetical protein